MNEPTRQSFRPMLVVAAYFAGFATAEKLAQKAIQDARDKATAEMAQQAAPIGAAASSGSRDC